MIRFFISTFLLSIGCYTSTIYTSASTDLKGNTTYTIRDRVFNSTPYPILVKMVFDGKRSILIRIGPTEWEYVKTAWKYETSWRVIHAGRGFNFTIPIIITFGDISHVVGIAYRYEKAYVSIRFINQPEISDKTVRLTNIMHHDIQRVISLKDTTRFKVHRLSLQD